MKPYNFFLLFIIVNLGYAQESLKFDTKLTYETEFIQEDESIIETRYILTNSKDNSFTLKVKTLDSLNYEATIKKQDDIYSKLKINKSEFDNNTSLSIQ